MKKLRREFAVPHPICMQAPEQCMPNALLSGPCPMGRPCHRDKKTSYGRCGSCTMALRLSWEASKREMCASPPFVRKWKLCSISAPNGEKGFDRNAPNVQKLQHAMCVTTKPGKNPEKHERSTRQRDVRATIFEVCNQNESMRFPLTTRIPLVSVRKGVLVIIHGS